MQLMDTLFNWLQIKVVWDARPADRSAKDTVEFLHRCCGKTMVWK